VSDLAAIRRRLDEHDQSHLLRFFDELDPAPQAVLLAQIERLDLTALDEALATSVSDQANLPQDVAPCPAHPIPPITNDTSSPMRDVGEALIRRGAVAAFTPAGGQGTRLGWSGPKGSYPATVVTGKPLFRCFAEQILATKRRYAAEIPWYIMTSPDNDAATRAFFLDNNCFGLERTSIMMFPQAMMPTLDARTRKILLAEKHRVAMHPDGHGGAIRALHESGALEDMQARGIEHISWFQVDNPLVRAIDPAFLGLHAEAPDSSAEMSSKMVTRNAPDEAVGVFVRSREEGRDCTRVIEYSDLPPDLASARNENGSLRFEAGSIAVHALAVAFVARLTGGAALPYHGAHRRAGYVDETGRAHDPAEPNAIKLETFIFDALPRAERSIVVETGREDEFAPIKNRSGVDSPATSHQLQSDRAGRWLEAHGVQVARDTDGHTTARIEISPLIALGPADLVAIDLPASVAAGDEVVL